MSCIWCKGRPLPDHDCRNFKQFATSDHEHHWHYLAFGVDQCCECDAILLSTDVQIIRDDTRNDGGIVVAALENPWEGGAA